MPYSLSMFPQMLQKRSEEKRPVLHERYMSALLRVIVVAGKRDNRAFPFDKPPVPRFYYSRVPFGVQNKNRKIVRVFFNYFAAEVIKIHSVREILHSNKSELVVVYIHKAVAVQVAVGIPYHIHKRVKRPSAFSYHAVRAFHSCVLK
jgi:hypothetical protein